MPKNKPTGLSMYIEEVLKPEKLALEGKTYKTQHLVAEGHTRYKDLTDEERAFYVNMAKGKRLHKKVAIETQSAQKAEKREQLMSLEWKKAINVHLDKYNTTEGLKQHRFHFVGVQYALRTDEGEYRPVEIGLVQWCMLSGIDDSYHTFIDPGTTPLGYAFQVSSHAEESHQIEEERFKDFSNSYDTIWQHFHSFVSVQGVTHPVYCMKRNIAQVEGSLDWLAGKAWSGKKIQVLPIEELVIQLFSVLGESSFPLSITLFLKSIRFEHLKNTKCSEHSNVGSEHCAIGHAKMMSYLLSEALSGMFDFEITQKHIPEEDLGSFTEARVANERRGNNNSRQINEDDEEEEEEEEDDDDSGDDDDDLDKDGPLMNVNDFKVEFGESSSPPRRNDSTGGYQSFRGNYNAPPNRTAHNSVRGVSGGFRADSSNNRHGNDGGGRSFNDESGRDEGRGSKLWGRGSNPDASMRMMRGGRMNGRGRGDGAGSLGDWDNFNRELVPFSNQSHGNNQSLKSSEILITDEKHVAEARTELMRDRWNDGGNAFDYDNYTKNICTNKSFGNSYNNQYNNNHQQFYSNQLNNNQLNNNQYNNYNNNQYYNNQYNNSSQYAGYVNKDAMPYSTNNYNRDYNTGNYNNYNNDNYNNANYHDNYNNYNDNYNNYNNIKHNNHIYNQPFNHDMNAMRANDRYNNANHNRNNRRGY